MRLTEGRTEVAAGQHGLPEQERGERGDSSADSDTSVTAASFAANRMPRRGCTVSELTALARKAWPG